MLIICLLWIFLFLNDVFYENCERMAKPKSKERNSQRHCYTQRLRTCMRGEKSFPWGGTPCWRRPWRLQLSSLVCLSLNTWEWFPLEDGEKRKREVEIATLNPIRATVSKGRSLVGVGGRRDLDLRTCGQKRHFIPIGSANNTSDNGYSIFVLVVTQWKAYSGTKKGGCSSMFFFEIVHK